VPVLYRRQFCTSLSSLSSALEEGRLCRWLDATKTFKVREGISCLLLLLGGALLFLEDYVLRETLQDDGLSLLLAQPNRALRVFPSFLLFLDIW
jgi:hypothetical protein